MSMNQWDERYAANEFVYGTEPNDFLRSEYGRIPAGGNVLCLADGEGRNGVFLAQQGFDVTSVDMSSVGLEKAQWLAASRNVKITTEHADLATYDPGQQQWDAIVSIFCHVPADVRECLHGSVHRSLRPGGVFILEAYTPEQPRNKTGGPPQEMSDRLMTADGLIRELVQLNVIQCQEIERDIHEGRLHNGHSSVVQCIAIKEGSAQ